MISFKMEVDKRVQEIIEQSQQISNEEKEKFLNEFDYLLDAFWKLHKEDLDKKDLVINSLLERMTNKELELLDKAAIMQIFGCESDKALKILKMMYANQFGCKVGKEYYITKNEFKKFMESYKGKDLKI